MTLPRTLPGSVTHAERRWVMIFATIVMLITTIPYLVGYASQGQEWRFTGFIFGVEDGNSYIAKMLLGSSGSWMFRTPYTASYQRGVIAFLPYILLGKLAQGSGVHEQLVALYHLFRIGAGFLMILASYDFLALFCHYVNIRRFGVSLIVLGGGLGWLLLLIGQSPLRGELPLEFYSPETFGFLSLYGIPHLALARALFLWALIVYLKQILRPGDQWLSSSIKIGIFWLLTALAQPITAVVLGVVLGLHLISTGVWQIVRWLVNRLTEWSTWFNQFRMVVIASFITAPFLLYYALVYSTDPFIESWSAQNILPSPQPVHYVLAYGVIVPFSLFGAYRLTLENKWVGLFFLSWLFAFPFLAYAPVNVQRRLPEGIWVVLITLMMYAMEIWLADQAKFPVKRKLNRNQVLFGFVLLVCIPSTVLLIIGGTLAAGRTSTPVFRPGGEKQALEQIAQLTQPGDVVLSAYNTGNALPAWAPVRVLIGHGPESVKSTELEPAIKRFFNNATTDENRGRFIRDHQISFVFWGPEEKALGSWDPSTSNYLSLRYQVGGYSIFQVTIP